MSQELLESSKLIDEQFKMTDIDIETVNFWKSIVNLFI